MDFRLSDETLEWRDYCRKFAREVIRPAAPEHDREESVPYEVMREAYEWKLAGLDWLQELQNDPEGLKGVIYGGAPLGLRRHRPGDLGLVALRRRNCLIGHARADRDLDPEGFRHEGAARDRRIRRH